MLGMVSGRNELVAEAAERGLEIAAEAGDEVARARCLAMAAYPYFFTDFERCQRLAEEARRGRGDRRSLSGRATPRAPSVGSSGASSA